MPKRLTDTEKFHDPWFRQLPPAEKLLWLYACDRCDAAGVWAVDLEFASLLLGCKLAPGVQRGAGWVDRVIEIEGGRKWWLPRFITFQNPRGISSNAPIHASLRLLLERHGLAEAYAAYCVGGIVAARESLGVYLHVPEPETPIASPVARNRRTPPVPASEAEAIRNCWNEQLKSQFGKSVADSRTDSLRWIARRGAEHTWAELQQAVERYFEAARIEALEFPYKLTNFFGEKSYYLNYMGPDWSPPSPSKNGRRKSALVAASTETGATPQDILPF
jgi:hypothetical protein